VLEDAGELIELEKPDQYFDIVARREVPGSWMACPPVPEGRCDRSLARSAWDSATSKEPSRRVRCDSRRSAPRFEDWSD
jgi:hypothetical protein